MPKCDWCTKEEELTKVLDYEFCRRCTYYMKRIMSSFVANMGLGIPFGAGRPEKSHIVELLTFIRSHDIKTVLEYGSGMTTDVLSMEPCIEEVVSYEADPAWFGVCKRLRASSKCHFIQVEVRQEPPAPPKQYDLGLVDGPHIARDFSIRHAKKYCKYMYLHDPCTDDQKDELKIMENDGWRPFTDLSKKDAYRFWERMS